MQAQGMGCRAQTFLNFILLHLFLINFKELICSSDKLNNTRMRVLWQAGGRKEDRHNHKMICTDTKEHPEIEAPLPLYHMMTYKKQVINIETFYLPVNTLHCTFLTGTAKFTDCRGIWCHMDKQNDSNHYIHPLLTLPHCVCTSM